jgi:hypothetical protein
MHERLVQDRHKMHLASWVVIMVLAVLWLVVAVAISGFKVFRQRMRIEEPLDSADTPLDYDRYPQKQAARDALRPPSTWGTILAGLIVFGLALAALAFFIYLYTHAG